jgi:hypothetical protein
MPEGQEALEGCMFAAHPRAATSSLVAIAVSTITLMAQGDTRADRVRTAAVATSIAASTIRAPSGQVGIVDQNHGRVMIFDVAFRDWNREAQWSWTPHGAGWVNLSDVKFRSYGGRNTVLVAASGGKVATVDLTTRRETWSAEPGGNPHAIELLPTGAVAVASSTGGRLTLYGKDQHQASDTEKFERAHAVLWDPDNRLLWALGGDQLCSYRIGGSANAPRFDAGKRCKQLPLDGPRQNGESLAEAVDAHDLSPVHGNPAEMWFSTRHAVYLYNIRQSSIRRVPGSISQPDIKSVGNQAGGWVVTSQVKHANPPPHGKTIPSWGSPNIWLYNPDGSYLGNRFVRGAAIYKARPVVWERR